MIPGITVKLPTQRHVPRPHTVRIPNNMAKSCPHRVTFICPLSPIQFASCWYPYHSLLIECLCGRGGDAVLSTLREVFPPTRGLCLGLSKGWTEALSGVHPALTVPPPHPASILGLPLPFTHVAPQ